MAEREQPGVVRGYTISNWEEWFRDGSVRVFPTALPATNRLILLVDPRENDVVPKRPRPAKKKGAKRAKR